MSVAPDQRDTTVRPTVTFDDRLWPVLAALLVLALLGAGVIYRVASFEDPRWWANGWTYLGTLIAVTLLLILGVSRLDRSRRGLQLAAVLSLLAHILLFVSLNQYRLAALADARVPDSRRTPPVEEFRAPDYHIRAPDEPTEEFDKPVTTETPEEPREELSRRPSQKLDEMPLESQPSPLSGTAPDVQPQLIPLKKLEEAAPRLAPESAELSRAEASTIELNVPEPVAVPELDVAAELDRPTAANSTPTPVVTEPVEPKLPLSNELPASRPLERTPNVADSPRHFDEPSIGPQVPSLPGPLTMRHVEAPQVRSAQIADVPRAQSGSDKTTDEPQPLVPAPLRAGSGITAPREVGTLRDSIETRVAVRPSAPLNPSLTPKLSSDRQSTSKSSPLSSRAGAPANQLAKSMTNIPANPVLRLPSLAELETEESDTVSPNLPKLSRPAPSVPAIKPSQATGTARLPVPLPAPTKQGGLSDRAVLDLGTPNRRASEESQLVDVTPGRLLSRRTGGPPTIDGRSREPTDAFARRGGARRNPGGPSGRMAERTEAAIELGLVFLANHQRADGSWSLQFGPAADVPEPPPTFRAETAATGLGLLSFLGAGYDHYGGAYADVVQRALDDLIKHQRANGDLYRPEDERSNRSAWLYSHGIATIALCEAYGMTGDPVLRAPAQKAIDFIIAAQDPRRGAWRYVPGNGSDTSVSGWQLMALKSGELAGLEVPRDAYDRVRRWLDGAQVVGSRYVYNPSAPDTPQQRHGRSPTPAMTAVGLLMRLYTGLDRDDAHMVEGAEYLLGRLPENGASRSPARDTYYWYYATQVMFHMRGKYWSEWNGRLHPLLVDTQQQSGPLAGSWDPRRPVPDRWGPHAGRIYVTTLNLLSLEVYYRHLPLYESTAK